jgi:glycine betaine/proline transport system substrate-binding protein
VSGHRGPVLGSAWRTLAAMALTIAILGCVPAASGPSQGAATGVPTTAAPASSSASGGASCGRVTLAVIPWAGSEADAAVVGAVLEHELGCTVVKREVDDETAWQYLASRGVDAILEVWDHEDLAAKYIGADKVAVDAGPSGTTGVVGWFVPKFFADAHPDILTAKSDASILNRYADQLRTPASGQNGQLLDGDPGFVTEDAAMIRGFGLNFTVVYSGSEEATQQAIRAAVEHHMPILAYYVRPNWFSARVELVHVELPAFSPGCNKDPDVVACDYPTYQLGKVASAKFAASGSPAYEVIRRFSWTNEDQEAVAASIVEGHLSADAAARQWLDANPQKWRTWLP